MLAVLAAAPACAQSLPGLPIAPRVGEEAPPAQVTTAVALPSAVELDALIRWLESDRERRELAEELRALQRARSLAPAPAATAPVTVSRNEPLIDQVGSLIGSLTGGIEQFTDTLGGALREFPQVVGGVYTWLENVANQSYVRAYTFSTLIIVVSVVLGGLMTHLLMSRGIMHQLRRRLLVQPAASRAQRFRIGAARYALDLMDVAAFFIVAWLPLTLVYPVVGGEAPFEPPGGIADTQAIQTARQIAISFVNAITFSLLLMAHVRLLLVPGAKHLRLVPVDHETALYLMQWARRIGLTAIVGGVIIAGLPLIGFTDRTAIGLLQMLGFAVIVLVIVFVFQNQGLVARWLRGREPAEGETIGVWRRARRRLAAIWHILVTLYLFGFYFIWAFSTGAERDAGFAFMAWATVASIAILVCTRLVLVGLDRLLQQGFGLSDETKAAYPLLEDRMNRYLPVLGRVVRIGVWVLAVLSVLAAWGLDSFGWTMTGAGRGLLRSLGSMGLIVLIGVVLWEIVSYVAARWVQDQPDRPRSARLRTLVPLVRSSLLILLVVVVVVALLSEVGLDPTPLLAGAGVIGLAIGFGAQTLVKDVITGFFMLIEDTISIGDVVEVGSHSGVVENLSIRTLRLRDFAGGVHTVPFSEVTTVVNLTKDFSFYVFDVGIAYHEDPDDAMKVLEQLGKEMRADPHYARQILAPLEIVGVDAFTETAVVIKCRFKTRPLQQWNVGREFNRRIKKRFAEMGIEIPFSNLTVSFQQGAFKELPAALLKAERAARAALRAQQGRPAKRLTSPGVSDDPPESHIGVDED